MNKKIFKVLLLIYQIFGILGEILIILLTPDHLLNSSSSGLSISQDEINKNTESSIKVASSLNSAIRTAITLNNKQYEKMFPTFIPTEPLSNSSISSSSSSGNQLSLSDNNNNNNRRLKREKKIIVTLDGGGMKGIVCLKMLQELGKSLNFDIIERADMVGGTSTGSIIGFGRTKGLEYHEIVEIYRNFGKNIFQGAIKNFIVGATLANSEKKKQELRNVFGDQLLSEFNNNKKVFAVVSLLRPQDQQYEPKKFSNYNNKCKDMTVTEAIDSSSAAPLYFKPVEIQGQKYVDGGILQNNPILIAHREAQKQFGDKVDFIFISFGTGLSPDLPSTPSISTSGESIDILIQDSVTTTPPPPTTISRFENLKAKVNTSINNSFNNSPTAKLKETVQNTVGLIKTAGQSIGDSETAHHIFRQMRKSYRNFSYYRFNPILSQNYTLADYSKSSIQSMQNDATNYMTSAETLKLIQNLRAEIESINSSF